MSWIVVTLANKSSPNVSLPTGLSERPPRQNNTTTRTKTEHKNDKTQTSLRNEAVKKFVTLQCHEMPAWGPKVPDINVVKSSVSGHVHTLSKSWRRGTKQKEILISRHEHSTCFPQGRRQLITRNVNKRSAQTASSRRPPKIGRVAL